IERRAVHEEDEKAGVVRPDRAHDVAANLQVDHAVYVFESAEALAVLRPHRVVHVRFVLERHHVNEHHSSSPSMSSSATSTTTLWTSMRNHWRNVVRSREAGHAASSSVHAASWNSNSQPAFSSTHSCTSSSTSNSGSRNADPYGFARPTVIWPRSASASWCSIQSR